jgi:hypothetical protein
MAKKKAVRKRPAAKKGAPRKSSRATASPQRKVVRKKVAAKKKSPRAASGPLGRARVSGTAELDQYFLKDYEARQVFTFLGVKTLKELEAFSPQQIIDRLSAPMVQTVTRIRKALSMQNRYLAGDQKFAVEFKKQMQAALGR